MNTQSTGVTELNTVLEKLVRNWICIVNLDAEFCFRYDDDDPDPRTSNIIGYQTDVYNHPEFGSCIIGDEGPIEVVDLPYRGGKAGLISTYMLVEFPEPLMQLIVQHICEELFEHPNDYIGFRCKIDLPDVERYSLMMYLHGSVRDIRLDACSETVLRSHASALAVALQPYAPWFEYAAYLADQFDDHNKHALLIEHLRAICAYLGHGGELKSTKLTSLCDVAGSLQPVVALIQKKMPELVV
ncbi:hypothetical protein HKCCA1065_08515 [Rhodobacterales bacterium HKCCA1065]|nr:hypothetical protein [Rhodobacterales bacterium HKCCA1065]